MSNKTSILSTPIWSFLLSNLGTFIRMIKAYLQGKYRIIPYGTIIKLIIAAVYIFFIFDLIPDFIPIVGWLDDIAVATWVLHSIRKDIQRFRNWETSE